MFNFFNKNTPEKPQDVKAIREALIVFIKQELQKMEGGEGKHIKGFQLYLACKPAERYMYESAVYMDEENRFKEELQRIADDFAIDLPEHWLLELLFAEELPAAAIKIPNLDAGLIIKTPEHVVVQKSDIGYVRVLNGEAEQAIYELKAGGGRINIGRDKQAQDGEGFMRENDIAFPSESSNACNKYISRQHAHIEWSNETDSFLLYADDGGVPPRNKVKVRSVGEHNPVKLTFTELGHHLQEGDQIILGESAVLEFSFRKDKE